MPYGDAVSQSADLRLPADNAYVAAVRLTTTALAARLGFTIDDIEDARIAVNEACTLLLEAGAAEGGDADLDVHYDLGEHTLSIDIAAPAGAELDHANFGWQLLRAVTADLRTTVVDGRRHISYLSKPANRSE